MVGFSSLLPSISSSGYCRPPIPYAPPGMQNDLARGARGTAICMLASSSSARSHPLPPSISISSSSTAARTWLRSCTLHVGPAGPSELRASPLPCPPDIVLLLGKRCQRGLSSFSLFHNLPKGETERREVGTPDTLDTRNSPSLPLALPPLFHAVSLCHWHIVRRPGRNEEASAARLSPPSL